MLNDISFKDIHMCRINLTHTICIWGNHIFDSNFEKTLPLNLECLLICRSIGIPDDCIDKVQEKQHDDDTVGKEYIECWKFTIPRQFIHLMDAKKKQIDRRNKYIENMKARNTHFSFGDRKNDDNY